MRTVTLIVMVVILDLIYAFGSLINGYSIQESFVGSGVRLFIELICLYSILKGRLTALYCLLIFWGGSIGVFLYFAVKIDSFYEKCGLVSVSLISLSMCLLAIFIFKKKRSSKNIPIRSF